MIRRQGAESQCDHGTGDPRERTLRFAIGMAFGGGGEEN